MRKTEGSGWTPAKKAAAAERASVNRRTHGQTTRLNFQLVKSFLRQMKERKKPGKNPMALPDIDDVVPEWQDIKNPKAFLDALDELGPRASKKVKIRRIDPGKPFGPGNIRWGGTRNLDGFKRHVLPRHWEELEAIYMALVLWEGSEGDEPEDDDTDEAGNLLHPRPA